ncbi:MAG: nucleotidyl transferase AbiEii/AbiGii toxin family protein [Chryseobacterium sp.]|nr:MAG: nucleotidyl transferase AbiEii/AbiGii toxin family protein [Chryseobacterium sp.]
MLYYNTVSPQLEQILKDLMRAELFLPFRLVGGTALSLYYGHRMSVDIDLFTPAEYGSLDFWLLEQYLRNNYPYVDTMDFEVVSGKSFYIGENENNCIKLDLYYNDGLIDDPVEVDGIRLASKEAIIAMKMDVIQRTGRRKDFWDIHELIGEYSIEQMFALHEKHFPWQHKRDLLIEKFTDFDDADDDLEPECLKDKKWELIKLDLAEFINGLN